MRNFILPVLFVLSSHLLIAQQSSTSRFEFLEGGLNFPPLIANTYEPRVGFLFQTETSDLRLDIGNSIDIVALNNVSGNRDKLTLGADFFTWTALRQDENFHFPVDAVDYLFGLNVSYSRPLRDGNALQCRVRWSHISAHMVDGRYNKETSSWRDDQLPRVYSREFFEIIPAFDYKGFVRPYAGITYVYHIDPAELGKMIYQAGIEATMPHQPGDWFHPYIAYDIRLHEIGAYTAAHSMQAGVKAGQWHGKGLNVFVAWYNGMNIHGEYHDTRASYWGTGVTVDF